jgi:N-acetylglutamate synthase-like GNAT family acetyltransferase
VDYTIRKARLDDREAIAKLIAESARGLSRAHYSAPQIEAAILSVFGVDSTLIEDGTYFVAERESELIGCGGWSKRKTLFGGDQYESRDSSTLDPEAEPARIRAFFIHPRWSRKGIARAILLRCESEARADGFRALELMSTLPGVKLYESCGYKSIQKSEIEMNGELTLGLVQMRKMLE